MGIEWAVALVAVVALLVPAGRAAQTLARGAGRAARRTSGRVTTAIRRLGVRGAVAASVLAPAAATVATAQPAAAATVPVPLTERPNAVPVVADAVLADARLSAVARPTAYVVRPGDSLWSIAAAHLGPHATDADVARAWPRWHRANRARIGSDPSLLRPGTRLAVPTGATHSPSTPRRTGTSAPHPAPSPDLADAQVPAPSLDPDRR